MMNKILLSVIIPIYNKAIYLPELWNRLVNQSFKDYECILIDDGSSDESGNLCDEICKIDKRFTVHHVQNGGVSKARNLGLSIAKGKYITFVDADDLLHEDYLKNLIECITKSNADIVIGSILKVWKHNQKKEKIASPLDGLYSLEEVLPSFCQIQYSNGIYGYCCAKLFKKQVVKNIYFDEKLTLAEDLDFYLSIYPNIEKIYFDDKPYYYYLQEAENSSMQKSDSEIDYFSQLKIQLKMYNFLNELNALNKQNSKLVINRIYDYVYFTLYHSSINQLKVNFIKIRNLKLPKQNTLKDFTWQQKIVLFFYINNTKNLLYFYLICYRFIRQMTRRKRRGLN